jgi:hypothetical protein
MGKDTVKPDADGDNDPDPASQARGESVDPQSPTAEEAIELSDADGWLPQEQDIRDLLEDRRLVVPVTGAGVSQAAGLPGSQALAAFLVERFDAHPDIGEFSDPTDLLAVADDITNREYELERALLEAVARFFRDAVEAWEPEPITCALAHLPSRLIVTLNYDESVEKAAGAEGMPCVSWDQAQLRPFSELLRNRTAPAELTILHLHGRASRPDSIVLTAGTQGDLALNGRVVQFFGELLQYWTACFLGTRLDELHLLTALTALIGTAGKQHPLFIEATGIRELERRARPMVQRHGIRLCQLPARDHMRGVILFLGSAPSLPAVEHRAPPADASDDYVPTVLVECDPERDDGTTDFIAQLALGGRRSSWASSYDMSFFGEDDVAAGRRDLVHGVPGSGKSELMRYAAGLVAAGEHSVLVALNSVSLEPADVLTRLERWAARGEVLQGGPEITREVIAQETCHFFLDGLDEAPPKAQGDLAQQIISLARAFPRHGFTVASRPVEGNSLFARDEWRCLELAPGSVWQKRYLDRKGVRLADVLQPLAGGRDLAELLQLPFFLVHVVGMRDRLEGLTLWGVVRQLVGEALSGEEERTLLPLPGDRAREWLRELALAMHLAGRTLVRPDEIAQMGLPPGLEGSPVDICERLVERAMLQSRGQGYVFIHRIVGEALAAEALDEREPTDDLLDAIAPQPDVGISGVRADWRMPLTFLMPENEKWRAAIRERDILQWARAVPETAPIEERREAALKIWRTYVEWRIWIWDYDRPDLIQDGRALARHLHAGALEDVIEEIRVGLDDESPQVQGNAIRVLSWAGLVDVDLEPDLERILRDDNREGVVRRKAAIAAADLGLHSLLPLIVERGANPEDETEAQDCALAAMELVRPEEALDVSLELARNSGTHSVVITRIDDLLDAAELVDFLHGFAALRAEPLSTGTELVIQAAEDLTDPTPATISNLAAVAVLWGIDEPEVREVLSRDRVAALEGLREGLEEAGREWWGASGILGIFQSEDLREAGVAPRVVRRLEVDEEIARRPAEPIQVAPEPGPEQEEQEGRLSLSDLLSRPRKEYDEIIAHSSRAYVSEIAELDDPERDDLVQRMREWWPKKPFRETITWRSKSSWSMPNEAAAWLWFGPALDMELEPRQWAEIAASGVLFEEQIEWLQRQASSEGKLLLAEISTGDDGRTWVGALRAAPDPLPRELVTAVAARLRVIDSEYELREIAERLAEAGAMEALVELSQASDDFARTVQPYIASLGDTDALNSSLARLAEALASGRPPDSEHLTWLAGVGGRAEFLPTLFDCLVVAYRARAEDVRGGWSFRDAVTPLMGTIREIGGPQAIALYDELLENNPDVAFLRLERDAIVDAELASRGVEAGIQAASAAGLPIKADP